MVLLVLKLLNFKGKLREKMGANAISERITTVLQANPEKMSVAELIGGRVILTSDHSILFGTLPYKVVVPGQKFS